MFASIKSLFSSKSEALPIAPVAKQKPATPKPVLLKKAPVKKRRELIPYNNRLIPLLEEDHKKLLSIFTSIVGHASDRNYAALTLGLNDFSDLLKNHLRKEGLDLYMYLELVVGKEEGQNDSKVFREFRLEMKGIAVAVSSAINKYTNIPVTDDTVDQFISDFTDLGDVLVDRIEREEQILYPIYENHKA